jgi:hypothetical protein
MAAAKDSLLLQFRAKDTRFGVTRGTVKALSAELGMTETQVVHIALSKFAEEVLPAYAPDDGALTAKQLSALRKDAKAGLANGERIDGQHLFR